MFDIDIQGFTKLAQRWAEKRGMGAIVGELVQNTFDENVTDVQIRMKMEVGGVAVLEVEDDAPDGFVDLKDAYTLYATSKKVEDASKAGRFNAGEKFVVALCSEATISTTTGTVCFSRTDGRHMKRITREKGSIFSARIKMTREQYDEMEKFAWSILPPSRLKLSLNGTVIPSRSTLGTFEETLDTEISTGDGVLRKSRRKATVEVYEAKEGETPSIYELGLPVVETGDKWHVNVLLRVPLNLERDNITPAYLKSIRAFVANHMAAILTDKDANSTWVNEALSDPRISPIAARKIMDINFGEKRVVHDPHDPESTSRAQSEGYTVIYPRSLTSDQRDNVKKFDLAPTSSRLFPTPSVKTSMDGQHPIPREDYSPKMFAIYDYAKTLAELLLHKNITVEFYRELGIFAACYGPGRLSLTKKVATYSIDKLEELLIHEFAHDCERDHMSHAFHEACCRLGVKLASVAYCNPEKLKIHYDKLKQ